MSSLHEDYPVITNEDVARLHAFGPLFQGAAGLSVVYFAPVAWSTNVTFEQDHVHIKMGRYRCMTAVNSDRFTVDEGYADAAAFIPKGTQVKADVDPDLICDNVFVCLPEGFMDAAADAQGLPSRFREGPRLDTSETAVFSRQLRAAMLQGDRDGYDPLRMDKLVDAAVGALIQSTLARSEGGRTSGGLTMRQLRRVAEWVNAHLSKTVTLDDMAASAGLSRHHFARQFRAMTGISPYEFVVERRLDQAKRRLLDPTVALAKIAIETGFSDHAKFSNHFRNRLGVSPRDYRRIMTS